MEKIKDNIEYYFQILFFLGKTLKIALNWNDITRKDKINKISCQIPFEWLLPMQHRQIRSDDAFVNKLPMEEFPVRNL